mmetsp:Transcript_65815/g.174499  ORF Transcript_65815/g.174499 Transcript_65815/m.174499 type:complete len:380 (-) Transcript_65815:191-1330(-)
MTLSDIAPWLAILGSWLAFGSFAVPMKWKSVTDAQVHPLIYQCYKTFWTFATSHLVVFWIGYEFSWYGIISGLSWVPAGVAAVIAVQNVGMAAGQAVWQVTIIATSCVWGFAVFGETVSSIPLGITAFLLLLVGVVGMALANNIGKSSDHYQSVLASRRSRASTVGSEVGHSEAKEHNNVNIQLGHSEGPGDPLTEQQPSGQLRNSLVSVTMQRLSSDLKESLAPRQSVVLGLCAAVFNGVWGGSNQIPPHYAKLKGIHFCISFGTGSLIINILMIMIYFLLCRFVWHCPCPSFQPKVMALPGFLSGSMWSIGNFCSLYVTNSGLGEAVGYSLIQSSIIVSGVWGIAYYREMTSIPALFWCLCCAVCLGGVGLLVDVKH